MLRVLIIQDLSPLLIVLNIFNYEISFVSILININYNMPWITEVH